jgi:glycosyltransferase involved in cell wall biosynthesis
VAPLADSVAEWTVRRADRVRVVAGYLEEMVRDAGYRGEVDRYVTFSDFGSFLDEPPLPVPLEPRVAFAAAFEPYKAVDVLIDAWAKVVAKIPSAMLEMGGSGSQEGAIRERVKRAGLTDNVKFLGSLDRGQVKDLLDRSRFLTLPSRSEGLPRLIMESMARARAVVTTPVGDIPLLIEDGVNGLMVRPDDSDGLATALCRLLEDQELCSTLGRAGYDRVRERDPVRDYEAGVQRLADWAASKGKS